MEIYGDTGEQHDEFMPPQMFAREQLEWMEFKDTGIEAKDLPVPTTWHVLIFPKQPKKMSSGGIALPEQAQDVEMHLNYIGQVVAMGPLAGKNEKFENPDYRYDVTTMEALTPRYLWNVKVGDWVIYGKYSGMHKTFRGVRLLTVNDDDITDIITSPADFKVYI